MWEHAGYGDVYVISDANTRQYQFTRTSCVNVGEDDGYFGMTESDINAVDITFTNDDQSLTYRATGEPFAIVFTRREALPSTCENDLVSKTPVAQFNHVAQNVLDYYAFIEARDSDWPEHHATVSATVNDAMDDDALFDAIARLIAPLNDSHTTLESDTAEFESSEPRGLEKVVRDSFEQQTDFADIDLYAESLIAQYNTILGTYLDSQSLGSSGQLLWGKTTSGLGYVRIDAMAGFSESFTVVDEITAVKTLLDTVFTALADTPGLILDLRFNQGGFDAVSITIANYFASERVRVISKTARGHAGETDAIDAYLTPVDAHAYTQPVAVISGPDTVSAGEVFLLATQALPQFTRVGEASNGAFSDILTKTLPNGWELGLSNEVYRNHAGENFEVRGIPPDVAVSVFSLADLEAQRNSALEAASNTLGYPVTAPTTATTNTGEQ